MMGCGFWDWPQGAKLRLTASHFIQVSTHKGKYAYVDLGFGSTTATVTPVGGSAESVAQWETWAYDLESGDFSRISTVYRVLDVVGDTFLLEDSGGTHYTAPGALTASIGSVTSVSSGLDSLIETVVPGSFTLTDTTTSSTSSTEPVGSDNFRIQDDTFFNVSMVFRMASDNRGVQMAAVDAPSIGGDNYEKNGSSFDSYLSGATVVPVYTIDASGTATLINDVDTDVVSSVSNAVFETSFTAHDEFNGSNYDIVVTDSGGRTVGSGISASAITMDHFSPTQFIARYGGSNYLYDDSVTLVETLSITQSLTFQDHNVAKNITVTWHQDTDYICTFWSSDGVDLGV